MIIAKKHGKHHVEITTKYEGARVAAEGEDEIMYPAIATAMKKFDTALKHRKGQLKANKHQKPSSTAEEVAFEKVQSLDLA